MIRLIGNQKGYFIEVKEEGETWFNKNSLAVTTEELMDLMEEIVDKVPIKEQQAWYKKKGKNLNIL